MENIEVVSVCSDDVRLCFLCVTQHPSASCFPLCEKAQQRRSSVRHPRDHMIDDRSPCKLSVAVMYNKR